MGGGRRRLQPWGVRGAVVEARVHVGEDEREQREGVHGARPSKTETARNPSGNDRNGGPSGVPAPQVWTRGYSRRKQSAVSDNPPAADSGFTLDVEVLNGIFRDLVPHNRALGMTLVRAEVNPAVAVLQLPYDERLVGNPETGVLHGGVVTALVDAACGASVHFKLQAATPIATLDLRIDYLKPATPGKAVNARAECFKTTHNVAFARAIAYHDDEDRPDRGGGGDVHDLDQGPLGDRPRATPGDQAGAGMSASAIALIEEARRTGNWTPLVEAHSLCPLPGDRLRGDRRRAHRAPALRRPPGGKPQPARAARRGARGVPRIGGALRLMVRSATVVLPKTVTLTMDYLRSGKPVDTFSSHHGGEAGPPGRHRARLRLAGGRGEAHRLRHGAPVDPRLRQRADPVETRTLPPAARAPIFGGEPEGESHGDVPDFVPVHAEGHGAHQGEPGARRGRQTHRQVDGRRRAGILSERSARRWTRCSSSRRPTTRR